MNGTGLSLVSPHLSHSSSPENGLYWFLVLYLSLPLRTRYAGTPFVVEGRAEAISKFRGKLSEGRIINEIRCIPDETNLHAWLTQRYYTGSVAA